MSSTADVVRNAMREAGMIVLRDPRDAGVLRGYDDPVLPQHHAHDVSRFDYAFNISGTRPLLALVVIRENRVTYAEHRRRVFPFWASQPYRRQLEELYDSLRTA